MIPVEIISFQSEENIVGSNLPCVGRYAAEFQMFLKNEFNHGAKIKHPADAGCNVLIIQKDYSSPFAPIPDGEPTRSIAQRNPRERLDFLSSINLLVLGML